MSEHDEQVALFEYLALFYERDHRLKWIHAIPNGGKRHPATARKMKAEGVKAGVWDIFVPVLGLYSSGLYIEMKHGKNKLTDSQKEFGSYVSNQGYSTAICHSWEDAVSAIANYMSIPWLSEGL